MCSADGGLLRSAPPQEHQRSSAQTPTAEAEEGAARTGATVSDGNTSASIERPKLARSGSKNKNNNNANE